MDTRRGFESRCKKCGHCFNWKAAFKQKPPCPRCGCISSRSHIGLYGHSGERNGKIIIEPESEPKPVKTIAQPKGRYLIRRARGLESFKVVRRCDTEEQAFAYWSELDFGRDHWELTCGMKLIAKV